MPFFFLAALTLDIVSKHFAGIYLSSGRVVSLVPGVVRLFYVENRGAAFGIFQNTRYFLIAVSLSAVVFLLYLIIKKKHHDGWQYWSFYFLLTGAAGNMIDRVRVGYVVDFIDFPHFPTFNFADIFINIGVLLLLTSLYKEKK